jgi:hypothetical protein
VCVVLTFAAIFSAMPTTHPVIVVTNSVSYDPLKPPILPVFLAAPPSSAIQFLYG